MKSQTPSLWATMLDFWNQSLCTHLTTENTKMVITQLVLHILLKYDVVVAESHSQSHPHSTKQDSLKLQRVIRIPSDTFVILYIYF